MEEALRCPLPPLQAASPTSTSANAKRRADPYIMAYHSKTAPHNDILTLALCKRLTEEDESDYRPAYRFIQHVWTYREPFSSVTYQYDATSLTMQFPQTMPDWFFDSKLFSQHFGDVTAIVGP